MERGEVGGNDSVSVDADFGRCWVLSMLWMTAIDPGQLGDVRASSRPPSQSLMVFWKFGRGP